MTIKGLVYCKQSVGYVYNSKTRHKKIFIRTEICLLRFKYKGILTTSPGKLTACLEAI